MSSGPRRIVACAVLSGILALSLAGVVSLSASLKGRGKVVSASLSKTSLTAAQAKTVTLAYKISPASKRVAYLLSLKKGTKWVKVRSVSKTGSFKGSYKTTVKKLFGSKAVKVGQYRVKVSADANSLTREFSVKSIPVASPSIETDDNVPPPTRGSGDGDDEEEPGDGEEEPGDGEEEPPGGGIAVPAPFNKTNPTNGATGVAQTLTLSWSASSDAVSYQYCVDKNYVTGSNACHIPGYGGTGWVTTTSTSATVSGLTAGGTYYWQVSAYGGTYSTWADGGAWYSFTVAP